MRMEKEEETKFSSAPNLELDANGVLSKSRKSVTDGTDAAKNAKSGCQFIENVVARQNQQYTELLQRALNPQHAGERSSSTAAFAAANERLQPLQNMANLQHQQAQAQQFVYSSQPFWVQPQPSISLGATEGSWQAPAAFGAGASPSCQPQAPNFCYYPTHPSFPGSWDPSIWWGQSQTQPLLFPGMPNYPRPPYGFVSSQSWPMQNPSCVTSSSGQPLLRGVIKLPEKLSQKHQRLWEAQSAENVQLWNMIGHLQGELTDCKGHLIKLGDELSSLRSAATNEPAVEVGNGGIMVRGQPAKRGRSTRAITPIGSQPPLQPRTRRRKPATGRTRVEEAKSSVLEKESLNKMDDKGKNFTSFNIREQNKNEGISATIIRNNGIVETDDGTLNHLELNSSHIHEGKENSNMWSSGIISEDSKRNTSSIASPTFYTNGNASRQGITRWNLEDEDEAARFPAVGGHREMADEFSSGPEEIVETQNGSSWCGKVSTK